MQENLLLLGTKLIPKVLTFLLYNDNLKLKVNHSDYPASTNVCEKNIKLRKNYEFINGEFERGCDDSVPPLL